MGVAARSHQRPKACRRHDARRGLASEPVPLAGRGCSERISGIPESLVLGNPGLRIGFGRKADDHVRHRAGPAHFHGETAIATLDHAIIHTNLANS